MADPVACPISRNFASASAAWRAAVSSVADPTIDLSQQEEGECLKGAPVEVAPVAKDLLQERSCPLQVALAQSDEAQHVDRVRGHVGVVEVFGDGEAGLGARLRLLVVTLVPEDQGKTGQRPTAGDGGGLRGVAQRPFEPLPALPQVHLKVPGNGHGAGQAEGAVRITGGGEPGQGGVDVGLLDRHALEHAVDRLAPPVELPVGTLGERDEIGRVRVLGTFPLPGRVQLLQAKRTDRLQHGEARLGLAVEPAHQTLRDQRLQGGHGVAMAHPPWTRPRPRRPPG